MSADNVGAPVTPQQWDYIHEMGGALRSSLDNVTAVFAPSCIGHAVLTKRDWMSIKIDDISLVDALRCWERSTRKHKGKGQKRHVAAAVNQAEIGPGAANSTLTHRKRHRLTPEERKRRRQNMTPEERERRRHQRLLKMQRNEVEQSGNRNNRQKAGRGNNKLTNSPSESADRARNRNGQSESNRGSGRNSGKRRRNRPDSDRKVSRNRKYADPLRCSLRLVERCSWPQCNKSCPALRNPRTGEEMRFLELLASFGLDIEAVAAALGIDMQTLNNMDHGELVNLLTQQVS